MESITQKKPAVKGAREKWTEKKKANLTIAKKFLQLAAITTERAERLREADNGRAALMERAKADEYRKRGYRMKECARFITVKTCPDCGRSVASSAALCRDRVCPTCAWRLSAKRAAEMLQTLALITDLGEYTAAFLTLTVKNCEADQLGATLDMMSEAWHRMASKRQFRELVKGTARSVEITYNSETKQLHPHFHIILLLDCEQSEMGEMNRFFNSEWARAARLVYQPITDLRMIRNETILSGGSGESEAERYKTAILETFKYTIKDDSLADMPLGIFRYYVDGVAGKRLINYTGVIKTARKKLGYKENEEEEGTEESGMKCPDCGHEMLEAVFEWSYSTKTYQRFLQNVRGA